jgi:uncharacterized membrane protein (DUF106 family)
MEIDTGQFHNSVTSKLDELEDRIIQLERPKYNPNTLIALLGIVITVIGGIFTNIYITVSKIDTLGLRYENLNNQVAELKLDIKEVKKQNDKE